MSRRLLIVPHAIDETLVIREQALGRALEALGHRVFLVSWPDAVHVTGRSLAIRRWKQLVLCARGLLRGGRVSSLGTEWRFVLVHPLLLRKVLGNSVGTDVARRFNTKSLRKSLGSYRPDAVLQSGDLFGRVGPNSSYDVVDWVDENIAEDWQVRDFERLLQEWPSGKVLAASPGIVRKLEEAGVSATWVPNGCSLSAYGVDSELVRLETRRQLSIESDVLLLGYIGHHAHYSGVDFAVAVTQELRRRGMAVKLLLVGNVDFWRDSGCLADPAVVVIGAADPAFVHRYFLAADVGIVPQELSSFTDVAFQIKVVEHTAARSHVIIPPFSTWAGLAWPNVHLVERDVVAWADSLEHLDLAWDDSWHRELVLFDWTHLAKQLESLVFA